MAVHGTENYVYYSDKILGAGSTGTVYFGRHKRRGDSCAVKIFSSNTGSRTRTQVQENELEFMRRLQHENIVRLLAIEKDSKTADVALIMELCSEGSLQKRLSEPEFVHGLYEMEFITFAKQFVSGLSYLRLHGISHRDIKPGNILCNKQEDGLIVYKITDFGSSRELLGEDKSKALYGTEEYLHPAVYGCIFITKSPYGSELESHAELWSIGVTFYQVAIGRLPFQVHGGRANRETMYKIISRKPSGIISRIQKCSSSNFEEASDLPATCSYSIGLRKILVPLIAGLLEVDFDKQMNFETFFAKCEELEAMIVVYVFCVVSSVCFTMYVRCTDTYGTFQTNLEKISGILVAQQFLLYNKAELTDIVGTDGSILSFPKTTPDDPILLVIVGTSVPSSVVAELPQLFEIPNASSDRNLNSDSIWARDVCAYFLKSDETVLAYIRRQRLTAKLQQSLMSFLKEKFSRIKLKLAEMEPSFSIVRFNARVFQKVLDLKIDEASHLSSEPSSSNKTTGSNRSEKIWKLQSIKEETNEIVRSNCDSEIRLRQIIGVMIRRLELTDFETQKSTECRCEADRCRNKVQSHVKHGKKVYELFTKDRRRQLAHNEEQIHKYEKMKLEQRVQSVSSYLISHCYSETTSTNRAFRHWLSETFNPRWNEINQLDKNMEKLKSELTTLTTLTSEKYDRCIILLQELTRKHDSGYKDLLKSSGYHSQSTSIPLKDSAPIETVLPELRNQLQLINHCYEDACSAMKRLEAEIQGNENLLTTLTLL